MRMLTSLFLIATLAALSCGCGATGAAGPSFVTIKYEVTGTSRMIDVTVNTPGGGLSSFNGVSVPWEIEYTVFQIGDRAYLAAYNNFTGSGVITARIFKNGTLWKSATGFGNYAEAIASGTI